MWPAANTARERTIGCCTVGSFTVSSWWKCKVLQKLENRLLWQTAGGGTALSVTITLQKLVVFLLLKHTEHILFVFNLLTRHIIKAEVCVQTCKFSQWFWVTMVHFRNSTVFGWSSQTASLCSFVQLHYRFCFVALVFAENSWNGQTGRRTGDISAVIIVQVCNRGRQWILNSFRLPWPRHVDSRSYINM